MSTTVHNYDPVTKVYTGPGVARTDPLDPENVLVPAFATRTAAPEQIPEGMVAVFDAETDAWSLASAELFQPQVEEPTAPTLEQLKETAQASIDEHFARLYYQSVPNPAIAHEYTSAYQVAKAWLDGGMVDAAPLRVVAMAETLSTPEAPVTEQQAAEVVVLKWQEAEAVLDQRGAERLRAKAAIRAAVDQEGVFAAHSAGKAAMEAVPYTI
jgi:hypothetical protein